MRFVDRVSRSARADSDANSRKRCAFAQCAWCAMNTNNSMIVVGNVITRRKRPPLGLG